MRILLPTDVSALAIESAVYAVKLSKKINAEFILFHADPTPRPSYSFVNKLDDLIESEAISSLEKCVEQIKNESGINVVIKTAFRFGDPVFAINLYAKEEEVDLIIMGTKGENAIKNRLFGNVASGLLESTVVPTLFYPINTDAGFPKSIAFPTDLTNIDEEIEELIAFAQYFDARIDVIHIYPDMVDETSFDEERTKLQLIANSSYPHITFSAVKNSNIINGIHEYIESDNPDMICMFTYKTGILEHLFETSYTSEMTFQSTKPLLILRKPSF
jgi:nucleotide-binding universal stress UspA family protein